MAKLSPEQKQILRDAGVFAVKLWLDGLKDFVLAVLGLGAAAYDLLRGRSKSGFLFYRVMRLGARVDAVLDVFGGNSMERMTSPDSGSQEGSRSAPFTATDRMAEAHGARVQPDVAGARAGAPGPLTSDRG